MIKIFLVPTLFPSPLLALEQWACHAKASETRSKMLEGIGFPEGIGRKELPTGAKLALPAPYSPVSSYSFSFR